ncbi:RNA 2',3'-cyclic phosphodiesterase [Bacillus marasmi]|uniref:RNA 2',3'-cyclic phosphodiesterase n=1 Tax=Bacillus marasmi TaxID=1926279 RepID=UPI0011C81C41|nr:RNA 2',3'-cyclic phosphodiesterase [Bacillus marasmi]
MRQQQTQTHYFYALKLPNEVKQKLNEYCQSIQSEFPFSRWVHKEDYHITLAFLGHAPQDKLETTKMLIKAAISEFKAFPLTIQSLGTFGRSDAPRIFWAGIEPAPSLVDVRAAVFSACEQAGFKLETRPFHPHITMARKWQGDASFPLSTAELEKYFTTPISFQAQEIVLYQTHLDKSPKYEAVAIFPL